MNFKIFCFSLILVIFVEQSKAQQCGVSYVPPSIDPGSLNKIQNGEEAVPHSWPWIASLRVFRDGKYDHNCGGSLISNKYVVTAAHCLQDFTKDNLFVVLGGHNLDKEVLNSTNFFKIKRMKIHEKYDREIIINDIAIIELSRPVTFSKTIQPICLPPTKKENVIYNKKVAICGWGAINGTYGHIEYPNILQQTVLQVRNYDKKTDCDEREKLNYCLTGAYKATSPCAGDSGGPLMYFMNKKWYVYGATSYVGGNPLTYCDVNKPVFYAIVPKYLTWIKKFMKNA